MNRVAKGMKRGDERGELLNLVILLTWACPCGKMDGSKVRAGRARIRDLDYAQV